MANKMDPEDKDYVCTLTEYSLEKAKRELFEDPKQRLGAVQTLRAWIRAEPHFTSRVDTDYLLRVLRTAKFSQLRAREIVEGIVTMKTKYPDFMTNIDTHEPGILSFVEAGQTIPLPKVDNEGRTIMLYRIAAVDLANPLTTPINEVRSSIALQELIKERNEGIIVNGQAIILDLTGLTMKHMTLYSLEETKISTKVYLECNPGRLKVIHLYNGGSLVDFFLAFLKPLLKKKFSERIQIHDTMESLYEVFPMELWPDEYLPDDYTGPTAGPLNALADNIKRRLVEPGFRARLLDYTQEQYRSDKNKKDTSVPQESFRKLCID